MNRASLVFAQLFRIKPTVSHIKRHVILSSIVKKTITLPTMETKTLPKIIFVLGAPGNKLQSRVYNLLIDVSIYLKQGLERARNARRS